MKTEIDQSSVYVNGTKLRGVFEDFLPYRIYGRDTRDMKLYRLQDDPGQKMLIDAACNRERQLFNIVIVDIETSVFTAVVDFVKLHSYDNILCIDVHLIEIEYSNTDDSCFVETC